VWHKNGLVPEKSGIAGVVARWVPIVGWFPHYQRGSIGTDAIAGFTIWGLLIPEMIAYASLAGLPPQAGLYTLLASLVLYAVFGTSRQLVVAGTSASAVLVYSAVSGLSPKDPSEYATLAAGIVIITGLVFVVAGLCRLGFITEFLSRPVMSGFVFGLAVFVSVSQLPKILGLEKGEGDALRQLGHLLANLGHTSLTTLAVGLGALAMLFGLERFAPRIPAGLVVLVLGITLSAAFDFASHGVAIIGDIPAGLPSIGAPHLAVNDLWVLIPSALGMVLVIYSEALGAAKTFADKHGYRIDSNQEMIALGLANVGSGLFGGLAAGGSLSQTAVNDGAGARSEVSALCAAALSLITVVALTPLFRDLPEAVLAALIIHAVSHLMKVAEMREYRRLIPREFWLGMITLAGVLILDVLPGLLIGVSLSLLLVIGRASRPKVSILGRDPAAPGSYRDVDRHPEVHQIDGVLLVRPDAPLFYPNAQAISDAIDAAATQTNPPPTVVVLDLDANDTLDITSAEHLSQLEHDLADHRIQLCLAHVHAPVLQMAEATGLLQRLGPQHVFANIDAAVLWARSHRE
jgi:SulP family sulfate permease